MKLDAVKNKFETFLEAKVAPLPAAHKLGIAAAVLLLPVVLFYFLMFAPKTEEIARLTQQRAGLEKELAELELKTRDLQKFRAEKQEAEERFAALAVLLPQQKEIPSLLTNISSLGTASGLDFLSFRPKGEIAKDFYAEIPVDIQVRGQYHNVGGFFDQVSKLPRIVTVSNVKMGTPTRQGREMILSTSFNLVTYRFIEKKDEPAKKGK
ncbi:MAG: type 4a pilus biogenesis protein PilO [Thermodesulfobacteriota bacterium]